MIKFQIELYADIKQSDDMYTQGIITTLCPHCQTSNYLFATDMDFYCCSCKNSLFIPFKIIEMGVKNRIKYHKNHWYKNNIAIW